MQKYIYQERNNVSLKDKSIYNRAKHTELKKEAREFGEEKTNKYGKYK